MSPYNEQILDHYQEPRNWGTIQPADFIKVGFNPLCGDTVRISGKIKSKMLKKTAFTGQGCAVCLAAASILLEHAQGKTIEEILQIDRQEMLNLIGIELSPSRLRCGLLALSTLKEALNEQKKQ